MEEYVQILRSNKMFVNDPNLWGAFEKLMNERLKTARAHLEKVTLVEDIYRWQGEIRNIKFMLALRETVNNG